MQGTENPYLGPTYATVYVLLKDKQPKPTQAQHIPGCARFAEIWLKYSEFHILWSLSSVDFHTLTLQLPIQTPNSVAPELQAFVSSLAISAKRAHPRVEPKK